MSDNLTVGDIQAEYTMSEPVAMEEVPVIPQYTYDVDLVALDGKGEYTINRTAIAWSISSAKTLMLMKNLQETLIMTAKAWKFIEVVRNDYAKPTDLTNKRRVDTDGGDSYWFDFIQIDNEVGIIQGIEGTGENPQRVVTFNPDFYDFIVITNK